MKKNLLLFLFLTLTPFLSKAALNLSNLPLSHNQYMVTYTTASANEVVGVFDPWYPTADITKSAFTYSLVDSKNGAYAINSSSGIITKKTTANLTAGQDILTVRVTSQGRSQDYKAYIRVKAAADCYFIDPSLSSNGNGSKSSPYNSWASVTFKAGKAYFQKRGTTYTKTIKIIASGSNGNEIIIGAYGTGIRPLVTAGMSATAMQVIGSYIWFFEYRLEKNKQGINMESYNVPTINAYCLISDITLKNSAPANGMIYFKKRAENVESNLSYHRVFDVVTSCDLQGEGSYGLKLETSKNTVENFAAYNNDDQGISVVGYSYYNRLSGVTATSTGNGVELSGVDNEISYSFFKDNYRGVVIDDPGARKSFIHHCVFEGGTGDAGIKIRGYGDYWKAPYETMAYSRDITIEDNIFRNNPSKAAISVEYATKNTLIQRNIIHNNNYGILIGNNNMSVDSVKIFNNVFYSNTSYAIKGLEGNHVFIYDNTIDGKVDCSGTQNEIFRNNFYKTELLSVSTTSNSLDISTITTETYFKNYTSKDYSLKSTAQKAIDCGYNVNLALDFQIQPVVNKPDIGAFEYSTSQVNIPEPSIPEANTSLNTVYIDPENLNDELADGSIIHPFDSWTKIEWKEGNTYLQKRGTTTQLDKIIIGANNVVLAAYGEGDLPIILSETSTYLISGFEKAGIKIRHLNLQATNAVSTIYFLGNAGDSITVEQCKLNAKSNAIKAIDVNVLAFRYNMVSSENEGIYSTALINEFYYNIFKNCETAVNVMSNNAKAKIYNNVFFNNGNAVSATYASLTLYNNIFYLQSNGQTALNQGSGSLVSDCNIFYPEQNGFVKVGNTTFNSIDNLQSQLKVDQNSFTSDPLFTDILNENFAIKGGSPAINSGKDMQVKVDLSGKKIPYAGAVDIGAMEYTGINPAFGKTEESTAVVYPNPSNGKFKYTAEFDLPLNMAPELKIMDITGKIVYTKILQNYDSSIIEEDIELTDVTNGFYLVVMQIAGKIIKNKIIISK